MQRARSTCPPAPRVQSPPPPPPQPAVEAEEDPTETRRREIEAKLREEASIGDEEIVKGAALEERRKRKAEEAFDDRFDQNGNFKTYSFQLPVRQQKAKPKTILNWMKN